MSVTFSGRTSDGTPVHVGLEDPAYVNMANENARAFLDFLGLDTGDDLFGEIGLPAARRAIIRARALFERRVGGHTRKPRDTKRPGRCRVVVAGIDETYFERRLGDFERFVGVLAERGATTICWG